MSLKAVAAIPGGGGGGTPGGTNGQIQYNNAGSFGGFTTSGDATINTTLGTLTLATVNGNVGSFGTATQVGVFTVNAKGLVTAASNTSIQIAESQVTGLTTDLGTFLKKDGTTPLTGNWDAGAFAITCASLNITSDTNQIVLNSDTANSGTITIASLSAPRTWTLPNATGTVVLTGNTATLQNKTLDNTNTIAVKDTLFTVQDDGDATKLVAFQCSGISTGTTRTLTVPNASGTIALTTDLASYIKLDGTSVTTSSIPFAQGLSSALQITSSLATGTAPLSVASTTKVTNLNVDQVDGADVGTSGATIPLLNAANTWSNTQTFGTTTKLQFTDANAFINASSSGNLVMQGATSTTVGVVGNTSLGDGTLRTVYPNTDLKIDLGDGSHRFNNCYFGQVTITDGNNFVLASGTGTMFGTATGQKWATHGSTPTAQEAAATDLGTVLSNKGIRAAGTAYPLTTSGAVTLTGTVVSNTLALKAGGAAGNTAKAGGVIFDHFADANNGTTIETDLYSDTLAASTFGTNGDKVCAEYSGTFVGDATSTQRLKAYFGGTLIFDTGALGVGVTTVYWALFITCIRESSSIVRCTVALNTSFATLNAYATYTKVTGLTLTNTQILKITGTAAGATGGSNQITASEGYIEWKSAA